MSGGAPKGPMRLLEWLSLWGGDRVRLASCDDLLAAVIAKEPLDLTAVARRLDSALAAGHLGAPESADAPRGVDDFRRALARGDLAAAREILTARGPARELESKLDEQDRVLSGEWMKLAEEVESRLWELRKLKVREDTIEDLARRYRLCHTLFLRGRCREAIRAGGALRKDIDVEIEAQRREIRERIAALGASAESRPAVAATVKRRVERAANYLQQEELRLAREELRRAQILLENMQPDTLLEGDAAPVLPDLELPLPHFLTFPLLTEYLQGAPTPRLTAEQAREIDAVLPSNWRAALGRRDQPDPRFNAIFDFTRIHLAKERAFFFRNLWDVMGARGKEPRESETLLERVDSRRGVLSAFSIALCQPDWEERASFLNRDHLPSGLPVVIWYNPGPALALENLENVQPHHRTLLRSHFVMIATQVVPRELRERLHERFPTCALIEPPALLQVLLSRSATEARDRFITHAAMSMERPNPYQSSGRVRLPMFFGRAREQSELESPMGAKVFYGGRKVGKSSLFRCYADLINQRWDDPTTAGFVGDGRTSSTVAIYLDIRNAGVDGLSTLLVLRDVLTGLRAWGLARQAVRPSAVGARFAALTPTEEVQEFERQLSELLRDLPAVRVVVLLDEADNFVRYLTSAEREGGDARRNIGWAFRSLMAQAENERRFDVRLAGFQDLQLAVRDSQSPFWNFGAASREIYAVRNLSYEHAYELVARPMAYLGLRFERSALIERILDYTGGHPSIIQRFCRELVNEVVRDAQRGRRAGPGFLTVQSSHVERVFSKRDFRDQLVSVVKLNVEGDSIWRWRLRIALLTVVQLARRAFTPSPRQALGGHFEVFEREAIYMHIGETLGVEVTARLSQQDLNQCLEDLTALGVLRLHEPTSYSIANPYFVELFFETGAGQALESDALQAWVNLASNATPRERARARDPERGDQVMASPLTTESRERLRNHLHRSLRDRRRDASVAALLGHPCSGRSAEVRWLAETLSKERAVTVLHGKLPAGGAMTLDAFTRMFPFVSLDGWDDLAPAGEPRCLILEDCDRLTVDAMTRPVVRESAIAPGATLLAWLLAASRARPFSVLFTGGYGLASVLQDVHDDGAAEVLKIGVEPLLRQEVSNWFEVTGLVERGADPDEVWEISKGDLRTLATISEVLDAEAPTPRPLAKDWSLELRRHVLQRRASTNPDTTIHAALLGYDSSHRERLQTTYELLRHLASPVPFKDLPKLCEWFDESRNRRPRSAENWQRWLQAALLVGDLTLVGGDGAAPRMLVDGPVNALWGQLVLGEEP